MASSENGERKEYIKSKLAAYKDIFVKAAVGDFSGLVPIPEDEDEEFAELSAGINILTEVVRRRVGELEAEKAILVASINSLSTGFLILGKNKEIVIANKNISSILEIPESELDFNAIDSKLGGDFSRYFELAISESKATDIKELQFGAKFIRLTIVPAATKENVAGVVASIEDITEERNLDQSKRDFLSIASHEMRTPLAIIKGDIELIKESPTMAEAPKAMKGLLDDAYENSERLFQILNDFLDVVHLEKKSIPFKSEDVYLSELIKTTIAELGPSAEDKGLYLKFDDPDKSEAVIVADKGHTRQILINFINNAIHYTNVGGVTVRLEKNPKTWKVLVADTGIGIPKDKQGMLFKKFSTIARTFIQTKEYGSGLGLYISRILATEMGGRVALEESEPGKGSIFSFELPAKI